jgi:hypothetical protein
MTVLSLSVGLIRTALIALPLIAIQLTAIDDQAAVALSLLFVFQLFKGIGYDIILHFYGWEANLYLMALLLVKSVPFVVIEYESLYLWTPLLLVEIAYTTGASTKYKIFFDEWRFGAREDRDFRGSKKESDNKARTAGGFEVISWKNVVLFCVVVTAFNAARAADMWYHAGTQFDSIANNFDSLLFWSIIAETFIAIIFILRLRSLYSPYENDFWQDIGGLIFIYMYYEAVTAWVLPSASLIAISFAMVGAILLMCLVIERQVTQTHAGRIEFLGDVVVQWAIKAVEILLSEPLGQVIFVLLASAIAFFTRDTWYTTTVRFPQQITQYACAAQELIDGPVRTLLEFLSNPRWNDLLFIIEVYLSRIRIKLTQVIFSTYPYLQAGCEGASVAVVPIQTYFTIPFFATTWLAALLLVLQVFPEAERITNHAGFWITTFAASFASFLVIQLLGDSYVNFWYLVVQDTSFHRSYSDTGYWASCAQILQMVVCIAMYHHKVNDEKARNELSGKGGSRGSLNKAQSILDKFASPLWLFVGLGIALLVLGFYSPTPIDSIDVVKITPDGPPAWLHNTSTSLDKLAQESFALMFSKSLVKFTAVLKAAQWLCDEVNFDIPLLGEFKLDAVSGGIAFVAEKMEEAMKFAAKGAEKALQLGLSKVNVSIDPLLDALDSLPTLQDLSSLDILPIPSVELPSLKSISWVSVCVVSVAVLFIVVEVAALFLGTEFRALSDALKAMLVSAFATAVVFIVNLYYQLFLWNLSIVITWNNSIWIFAVSIVMFSVSILFGFIGSDEEEQERLELQPGSGVTGGRGGALYGRISTVETDESGERKKLTSVDYPLTVRSGRRYN